VLVTPNQLGGFYPTVGGILNIYSDVTGSSFLLGSTPQFGMVIVQWYSL
jgi:hypothetical protein